MLPSPPKYELGSALSFELNLAGADGAVEADCVR